MALTSDYHGRRTRSRALSFHQSSVYVGTILGSWLGAWFAEHLGWRLGFYFFGGMGMVLALVLYKFLREPQRGEAEEGGERMSPPATDRDSTPVQVDSRKTGEAERTQTGTSVLQLEPLSVAQTLRVIFRTPSVPLLMLAFLGANFVATIFLTWTPTFLVEKFNFRLTSAGLSGSVFIHLASACSVPLAGWLADRLTRHYAGGRMAVQAMGLVGGAAFIYLVGKTADRSTLLLAMAVFGFCKGFYDSGIFASLYDAIEPSARGTAAGLMNTVGWGGGAVGPLFVGITSKYGRRATEVENMSEAIAFGSVVYLVSASLVIVAMVLFARRSATSRFGEDKDATTLRP